MYLITEYIIIYIYIYIYMYLNEIYFFVLNYDLIYMILDNLIMFDFDTQTMRVIHWYSDTQTNDFDT